MSVGASMPICEKELKNIAFAAKFGRVPSDDLYGYLLRRWV